MSRRAGRALPAILGEQPPFLAARRQLTLSSYDAMIMINRKNGVNSNRIHELRYKRISSRPNANGEVVDVTHPDRVRMAHELGTVFEGNCVCRI